ncbi:hypothetical protein TNCV_529641 [Trichonephila clavipes]|nr:hypothetical protein TNCV_529641 [Trichonephila clavipes]
MERIYWRVPILTAPLKNVYIGENQGPPPYLPSIVQEIDHYNSGGLMAWVGLTLDGCIHLPVFERGTLTAVRYKDESWSPMFAFSWL